MIVPSPLSRVPAPIAIGSELPAPPDVVPSPPVYALLLTNWPSINRAMPLEPKLNAM